MPDIRAQIEARIARVVATYDMWSPGAVIVAAVSGGADSLCLLGALMALRESAHPLAPSRIIVAHLDHGLRGAAGAEDARWVAAFAAAHGLECLVARADVPALARAAHRSLEDAARRARYDFLRKVARESAAARICTGHTRDDQAETLIMHWLRGGGLAGLAGMAPLSGDIARPLLDLAHAETVAYCAARGWQPCEDLTNADLTYLRNRVRHELLPILERYNPSLRETLVRNAALITADERYLEAQTGAAWLEVVTRDEAGTVALSLTSLTRLPLALRQRTLRRAARRLAAPEHGLEARHLFALEHLLAEGTSGDSLDLPDGLRVRREYDLLIFERQPISQPPPVSQAIEWPLAVPGVLDMPALGWRITARIREIGEDLQPPTDRVLAQADLDADAAGAPLTARLWRPGDRIQPLGMPHEKKLQDVFADAKVPRARRHQIPLVLGPRHLLWVPGLRVDERARITLRTRRVLALSWETLIH